MNGVSLGGSSCDSSGFEVRVSTVLTAASATVALIPSICTGGGGESGNRWWR